MNSIDLSVLNALDGQNLTVVICVAIAAAAVTTVAVVSAFFHMVTTVLRGHPRPAEARKEVLPCEHEDNLTGECLRAGGCRTELECEQARYNLNAKGE